MNALINICHPIELYGLILIVVLEIIIDPILHVIMAKKDNPTPNI
jgi:hypothetical protein